MWMAIHRKIRDLEGIVVLGCPCQWDMLFNYSDVLTRDWTTPLRRSPHTWVWGSVWYRHVLDEMDE